MHTPLKLLAIFAHPDDETLGMGGVLARYAAEGVELSLVCATRGERGWNGPEDEYPGLEGLGLIREGELRCAAAVLGIRDLSFLDLIDGDVDQAEPAPVITRIAAHIRRIRPQVVVTFASDGAYGHPDHIAISQFAAAALLRAADASFVTPGADAPHTVLKFYHMVDSQQVVDVVEEAMGGIHFPVDGVVRSHVGWQDWAITTRIAVAPYLDQMLQATACHQSQLPGMPGLLELPHELLMRVWGEGTYVRVYSLVNSGRQIEDDLFAGLR